MLDASVPGERGSRGLGAQQHYKGPIGRERQWELGHRRPPDNARRGGHFRLVRGLAKQYTTLAVQDQSPGVQIEGRSAAEAHK